jgi:hypothetical protein
MKRQAIRLANWRPTVDFPEPGRPTQAIRKGFEFKAAKLSSGWQANGAAKQARTRLNDTPDLKASEHNPERPGLRPSRRLIQ